MAVRSFKVRLVRMVREGLRRLVRPIRQAIVVRLVEHPVLLVLDMSTAHLPIHLHEVGELGGQPGVVAHATEYGWLLWVGGDDLEQAAELEEADPAVQQVVAYAQRRGCVYVLLDADAQELDGLATYAH